MVDGSVTLKEHRFKHIIQDFLHHFNPTLVLCALYDDVHSERDSVLAATAFCPPLSPELCFALRLYILI